MRRKVFIIAVCFLFLLNLQFALAGPLKTPTGKPEIIIPNTTKQQVFEAMDDMMTAKKYKLKSVGEHTAMYGKRSRFYAKALLSGLKYDVTPETRVSCILSETDQGIHIVASLHMAVDPDSTFEKISDFTENSYGARKIQRGLEKLKRILN